MEQSAPAGIGRAFAGSEREPAVGLGEVLFHPDAARVEDLRLRRDGLLDPGQDRDGVRRRPVVVAEQRHQVGQQRSELSEVITLTRVQAGQLGPAGVHAPPFD